MPLLLDKISNRFVRLEAAIKSTFRQVWSDERLKSSKEFVFVSLFVHYAKLWKKYGYS